MAVGELAPGVRCAGDVPVAGRGGCRRPAGAGLGVGGGLGWVAVAVGGRLAWWWLRGWLGETGEVGRAGDGDVEAEVAGGVGVEAGKDAEQALLGVLERLLGLAENVAGSPDRAVAALGCCPVLER